MRALLSSRIIYGSLDHMTARILKTIYVLYTVKFPQCVQALLTQFYLGRDKIWKDLGLIG